MRKKLLFIMVFVFSFFIFSNTLRANVERVSINGGASIRVKTETSEQGMRFTAKLNDKTDVVEHGFYLIFGEANLSKLQEEVNKGGKIYINDKEVFKVPVEGFRSDDTFSVVLTGIPEKGYLDSITAIAYAKVGNSYNFSKTPTTRSIAEVAVNLKNSSDYHEVYDEIISAVADTKRFVSDEEGNVVLASGIMETNPENLKLEFVKDWNKMFGGDLGDFDAYGFYSEARLPLLEENEESNKVILETNLFKFFTDRANESKWGWLLDLLMRKAGDNATLFYQVEGIFHGGVHGNGHTLYNGKHLAFSIANFFNGESELPEGAADFSDKDSYANLEEDNTGVVINPKNYENLYNKNDSIRLPQPTKIPQGYNFAHYLIDGEKLSVGEEYILKSDEVVFELVFNPINYFIRFYEGADELSAYRETYTIEKSVELFVPEKNGFEFLGWYLSSSLSGEVITCVEQGNIGHISLYAKWEQLDVGPTDEQLALEAKDALKLDFASGDSVSSVTKDLTLPLKGLNDAVISWASSNAAAISNVGVVVRAQANASVTLTATIKVGAATETKQFTVTVKAAEPVVDPTIEYTITFNLNGGAWPTTGGTPGYTNRDTMIKDFLTDFYNFLKPAGLSLNDFMHGPGKTSGFDGKYNEHVSELRAINVKTVDAATGKFVNQPAYSKWIPLIDLMDEYTGINAEQAGQFWSSDYVAGIRFKPFVLKQNLWGANGEAAGYAEIAGRIPDKLKGSTPGVAITVPSKYKSTDEITLPSPTKASDNFLGWYDNADYQGAAVTKIAKGSTGDKVFYARYASTVIPEKPKTDAEKMAEAKAALAVGYSTGDNANSVKGKVTLPATGLHGAAVTWATSNAAAISAAGAVTRSKDADVTVTLTATIKLAGLTETKAFTLKVLKEEPKPTTFTIAYELNGGKIAGYKNKTEVADAFLADLYAFVGASENLTTFKHGAGKSTGFDGLWYSNEDYRAKIFGAGIKSGNNNYFLSHSSYQAKWKPFADFMVQFVKVGNPDQDFWSSPYTGNLRMKQYFTNVKPGGAWNDEDMAKIPAGLSANVAYQYDVNSPAISLPTITRAGYTFEGWYDNAAFTGTKVTSIPKGSSGDKKFYAKWSQPLYNITLNLNSGALAKFTKAQLKDAFLNDLYSFIKPTVTLAQFKGGVWFSNEEYRGMIYGVNIKSGNNNYFLSSSLYQAKWKPLADFMVNFVKKNPAQDFWSSPFTGTQRLEQYLNGKLPSSAWVTADLNATPAVITPRQFSGGSQAIILPNATRSGYTFEGWYTANTGGSRVTQIAANATGNQTLYARWKKVETPVTQFPKPTINVKYTTLNPAYKANQWITVRGVVIHSTAVAGVMAADWYSRWNRSGISVGVHAATDNKGAWQYLPWTMRGWHGGGSSNNTHIGIEMCEPAGHYYSGSTMMNYNVAAQAAYFNAVYSVTVGLTAYLLKLYKLTVTDYTVIGHSELYARGMGSASADPMQWFPKHGKSMVTFRNDVRTTLAKL